METEDSSVEVVGPEGFPLWLSSSFGKATSLGSLTNTGAEFEEFSIVAAYNIHRSKYGYVTVNIKEYHRHSRVRDDDDFSFKLKE